MITDSKIEGAYYSKPEQVKGNEPFIFALMNWYDKAGNFIKNGNYNALVDRCVALQIPVTTVIVVDIRNSYYVDHKTPTADKQIVLFKKHISTYSASICFAFNDQESPRETPSNAGTKIKWYLSHHAYLITAKVLPVLAWVSDTNMADYPGDELGIALGGYVLAMWYDKTENRDSVKPPAPTDYDAKNYFYVYGDRVLSRVSESITAGLLGVAKLGAGEAVEETPVEETPDAETPGTTTLDTETKAAITGIYKIMNWFAKKLGYTE